MIWNAVPVLHAIPRPNSHQIHRGRGRTVRQCIAGGAPSRNYRVALDEGQQRRLDRSLTARSRSAVPDHDCQSAANKADGRSFR